LKYISHNDKLNGNYALFHRLIVATLGFGIAIAIDIAVGVAVGVGDRICVRKKLNRQDLEENIFVGFMVIVYASQLLVS
jgi:hypothetical protein